MRFRDGTPGPAKRPPTNQSQKKNREPAKKSAYWLRTTSYSAWISAGDLWVPLMDTVDVSVRFGDDIFGRNQEGDRLAVDETLETTK